MCWCIHKKSILHSNEKQKNNEVELCLKLLFKESETYPFVITSDNNSTFLSKECQEIFEKHNIIHDTVPVGDHASLGIVDKFARNLKTILHKRFMKNFTTNWVDVLSVVINKYNNTPHSSIDEIKPNEADKPENIYKILELNIAKKNEKSTFVNPFQKGDKVRVKLNGFHKKSDETFSNDINTFIGVNGKRVLVDNGKTAKYDMLSKISYVPEIKEQI